MVKILSRSAPFLILALVSMAGVIACASKPQAAKDEAMTASLPPTVSQTLADAAEKAIPESAELSDQKRGPLPLSFLFMNLPEPEPRFPQPEALEAGEASNSASPGSFADDKPELFDLLRSPRLPGAPSKAPDLAEPSAASLKLATAAPPASSAKPSPKPEAKTPARSEAKPSAKPELKPAAKPAAKEESPTPAPAKEVTASPTSSAPVVLPQAERQPDIARHISAEVGSRIELPFAGTGWTYLGEREGKSGILYESRRYDDAGLVFVLNAAQEGDYVLRFQRQDLLRGTTNEELVEVKVVPRSLAQSPQTQPASTAGAAPAVSSAAMNQAPAASVPASTQAPKVSSSGTPALSQPASTAGGTGALAGSPVFGSATVPSPASAGGANGGNPAVQAAAQNLSLPDTPDGLILTAKNELAANRVAGALAALDRFLSLYPAGMDEVFYLYGLSLEQNGPLKDVKRAYSFYKKVRDDYPQSEFWDKAAERASYIERHYFEIR